MLASYFNRNQAGFGDYIESTSTNRYIAEGLPPIHLQTFQCIRPLDKRLTYIAVTFSRPERSKIWEDLTMTYCFAHDANLILTAGYKSWDTSENQVYSALTFSLQTAPDEMSIYPYDAISDRDQGLLIESLTIKDYGEKFSVPYHAMEFNFPKTIMSSEVLDRVNSRLTPVKHLLSQEYPTI